MLVRCGLRKMLEIYKPGLRPSDVTILLRRDMSWWQLFTLIICVGCQSREVLDLELLFLEAERVSLENYLRQP